MPRTAPAPLTDEQLLAIVAADPAESTADLARRIGGDYFTVHKARQRIRRDGWSCRIAWRACAVCGALLASPTGAGRRTTHARCAPARKSVRARQRRCERRPGSLSTPYVARWREQHPEQTRQHREREKAALRARWREKPAADQQDDLALAHAHALASQAATVDQARQSGAIWSGEDDAYLIAHNHQPARDIALALGRTYYAVKGRRVLLRRRGLLD